MIDSSLSLKGRIREINILKECGKHAEMSITVVPDDMNNLNDLLSFVNVGTAVESDIDGTIIMCGKIKKICGQTTYSGAAVTVLVVSDSVESDIIRTSRVYQSPDKTYKQISEKISNNTTFEIKKNDLASKKEEFVIIQNNETDFEFANRMAFENETRLFVCADEKGKGKVVIADDIGKSKVLKNTDILTATIDVTEYIEALDIEHKEYIELGTKVKIDSKEYVVVRLNAVRKDNYDRFFIRLEKLIKPKEKSENTINLISLGKAKIKDNKDPDNLGRIQIEFTELDDSINDKKIWIQYINTLTAGKGGVFFVPDKDEIVEVIYQNGACYAYGCVRDTAASEKINNTDKKSLMLYDKTLIYEDKKITFEAGEHSVQVNEEDIYIKNKEYNVTMKKDSVVIGNEKSVITIKDKQVEISVNNKCKIDITDSNVNSTAGNGTMKLSSGKLEINASSGVDISTMKLDVK